MLSKRERERDHRNKYTKPLNERKSNLPTDVASSVMTPDGLSNRSGPGSRPQSISRQLSPAVAP